MVTTNPGPTDKPRLRFGYKASAEQFAPRELLEFSVLAENLGLTRYLSATTFSHGATPVGTHPSRSRGSGR